MRKLPYNPNQLNFGFNNIKTIAISAIITPYATACAKALKSGDCPI